jgi:hypothetical protein
MSKTAMLKSRIRVAAVRAGVRGSGRNSLNCISWRLPSGEGLAEFALRFGFLAPSLLGQDAAGVRRSLRREARG